MPDSYTSLVTFRICEDGGYQLVRKRIVPYCGEWAYLKGDSTAKAAEQQQAQFDQQLMTIFQAQYGKQSATLSYLQGKMQPIIDAGGQGYSPTDLTAIRTSVSDTNAQQYQNAQVALNNKIAAAGGSKLAGVAGATIESQAALGAAEAQQEAASQNAVTQQNEQLKQQNYWNAINVLNGTAAQENPLGYSSAATSGSNSVANLSQAYTQSQQSGLMGALGGVIGGVAAGGTGSIGGKLATLI
jgi:hypothetical protein